MMRWFVVAALAALFSSAAWGQAPARGYAIGPRDQVQIVVDEASTMNGEQTVAEDGTIVLPILGVVQARGLTEEQLAQRLRDRLESEGVRKATVSVTVSAYRSRPVSILGAVGQPGNHYIPGKKASLLEVLLDAGGLADGHGRAVLVRRRASNGLSDQIEIPVTELFEAGDPIVNIPIFAGDYISVPPAGEMTVHFLGEVQQPGSMTIAGNRSLTLLAAIARAGGLLETASKKIRIRRQSEAGPTELTVDYRALLSGREADLELKDGDLIIVKESFF